MKTKKAIKELEIIGFHNVEVTVTGMGEASFTAAVNDEQVDIASIRDDGAIDVDAAMLDAVADGFCFNNVEVIVDTLRGLVGGKHDSKH